MNNEPTVLYEDDSIIAINKPSGLVVHKGVKTEETLVDWILLKYPELKDVGESYIDEQVGEILRPGIVHRLDKDTSGVMLLAKNSESYETLKSHFQKGKVKKEYHSFVYGKPKRPRGIIDSTIYRSKNNITKQTTRFTGGKGREAKTEYLLEDFCENENVSFVRFFPKSGRMHQIRVHSQSLNFPIVCDSIYASKRESKLGFKRLALHSYRITIETHISGELEIIAPYPDDFQKAIAICKKTT